MCTSNENLGTNGPQSLLVAHNAFKNFNYNVFGDINILQKGTPVNKIIYS